MEEQWRTIIRANQKRGHDRFKELWYYKDLIFLFVKRDFKISYQQTLLGPLWIVLSPFLTTVVFTVIFGNVANISTETIPHFVFYMAGTNLWSLFSNNLNRNSSVFISNKGIFDKVYFPRLVMPITVLVSNFFNYLIQFAMFLLFWFFYFFKGAYVPTLVMLLLPVLWLQVSLLGAGVGLVVSALTTKYRDLQIAVSFGLQLWMYLTPIVYPLSEAGGLFRIALMINPMGPIIEAMRYAFFGSGTFSVPFLLLSAAITAVACFVGIRMFSHTEQTVVDTI